MRLSELIHLVWINIIENKFKVLLTSLGIIVGAATIVLVIAIGRGGQMDVADQFKNLSAGAIEVTNRITTGFDMGAMMGGGMPEGGGPPSDGGGSRSGGGMPGGGGMPSGGFGGGNTGKSGSNSFRSGGMGNMMSITLSEDDLEEIKLFVPDVSVATISANTKKSVLGGNLEEETDYTVAGVKPEYADISNLQMAIGDFITEESDTKSEKICVIGYSVALDMFDSLMEAYESTIEIDGRSYTVVGVLQEMGSVSSGISPDEAVFVPYSTAEKYVIGRTISPQITVVADDISKVSTVMENIQSVLSDRHNGATFTVTDAGSKMEAATQSANTLSLLLIAVASIVFIVGGIGIMNVLFVSVKERTREIGVLKALGASKRDILMEFLLEANAISTFGGIVGVAASFALVPLVRYTGMRVEPNLTGALLALLFAVVTGTVFGFYPAFKAASLIPIEALNQE
ncbi:ABC transporter permease [Acetanaerobacterium elongatum]|uniref:Putative ABC transport system permease protein n=1 Tax=Acetanaerobacterium elongatum TaxID=258515 RepID=A0A1G9V5Q7_9FIRM|nr:ABC transporter permease [Acetanaerobacterium elongatum]SDM67528.1 putative ABC transport system permease protein [Acetanaerobacterium elongatum]